jgi:hypothetical protein
MADLPAIARLLNGRALYWREATFLEHALGLRAFDLMARRLGEGCAAQAGEGLARCMLRFACMLRIEACEKGQARPCDGVKRPIG